MNAQVLFGVAGKTRVDDPGNRPLLGIEAAYIEGNLHVRAVVVRRGDDGVSGFETAIHEKLLIPRVADEDSRTALLDGAEPLRPRRQRNDRNLLAEVEQKQRNAIANFAKAANHYARHHTGCSRARVRTAQ